MEDLELSRYIVAIYDRKWYIGMVEDLSTEHQYVKISKFVVPSGPAVSFQWPKNDDWCRVPVHNILCCIDTPVTTTGRTYTITNEENYKISNLYAKVAI